MPFKLITLDDVKLLSKGDFGSEFDTLLDWLIVPAVGQAIAERRGWLDFDKKERTLFFSPEKYQKTISLPFANLLDSPAPQVWQDNNLSPAYGADTALVFNEDFTINKRLGWLQHRSGFAGGPRSVKVTMTGGYVTADAKDVPDNLQMGAAFGAKMLFDRREELGLTSRSLEGGSMAFLAPILRSKDFWSFTADYQLYPSVYDE